MNLIDSIRTVVQANLQDRDQVIDLAAEYAEECAELNARMRQVVNLLQAGLITEATQLADSSPPVLEKFAELDFPELSEWFAVLMGFGLDPPPPLLGDLAEEIDQAYADKDSLSDLLRMQRLLALRRAPYKLRLGVLRDLVKKQPDNPLWKQDVEELEEMRLKEITSEAKQAKTNKDTQQVEALLNELNQEWLISIPSQLIDSVFDLKIQLETEEARKRVQEINRKLNQCLSEFDFESALLLRSQWYALEESAQIGASDPLRSEVNEVFQWIIEEEAVAQEDERFKSTLRQFENSLDQNLPLETVEKLYFSVYQFDREIPQVLETRLQNLREKHRLNAKRKFLTTVVLAGIGILVVGGAIFYLISSIQYSGRKADALNSLQAAVNAEEWGSAVEIYDSLEKRIANEPAILELGSQARSKFGEEKERRQALTEILSQLEKAPKDPPPDTLITQASSAAKTKGEKRQVEMIENEVRRFQQELLKERNEDFLDKLTKLSDQLQSLETNLSTKSPTQALQEISQLSEEMKKLKESSSGSRYGYPQVQLSLVNTIGPLRIRCDNLTNSIKSNQKEMSAINGIRLAVGSSIQFKSALETYLEQVDNSPYASDFTLVNEEVDWGSDWNRVQSLSEDPLLAGNQQLTNSQASSILQRVDKLEAELPGFPFFEDFADIRAELNRIAKSDPDAVLDDLEPVLDWYPFTSLWLMKDSLGRKIYTPVKPTIESGEANTFYFESVPNRAGNNLKKQSFKNVVSVQKAPHTVLVEKIAKAIAAKKNDGPDVALLEGIRVATEKLDGDEQPEILVRAYLLGELFRNASKVNPKFAPEFKTWIDFLDNVGLKDTRRGEQGDWAGVSNSKADDLRETLTQYFAENLGKLDLKKLKSIAATNNVIPKVQPMPELEWIGFLLRTPSGTWTVQIKKDPEEGVPLYCITKNGTQMVLEEIGKMSPKKEVSLTTSRSGRPVYIKK